MVTLLINQASNNGNVKNTCGVMILYCTSQHAGRHTVVLLSDDRLDKYG